MPGAASDLEVDGGVLAAVLLDLIGDLLAFVQAIQASPLDGADMDEYVLAAAVRLMKPKPLVALNHLTVPVAIFATFLERAARNSAPCATLRTGSTKSPSLRCSPGA